MSSVTVVGEDMAEERKGRRVLESEGSGVERAARWCDAPNVSRGGSESCRVKEVMLIAAASLNRHFFFHLINVFDIIICNKPFLFLSFLNQ